MSELHSQAKSICQTLFDHGYIAYFAGGWVRDLLLGNPSQEIDIATSAPPDIIQELFAKTIPVGVAFGVVIVVFEGSQFEVTTFRKDHVYLDGRHPEGVDFSTPEKDALRRDFTINGMFYDPLTKTIHDYIGGQEDLSKALIRAIGSAEHRFAEDRLRMIRAIRFAAKFQFKIEEKTGEAIFNLASTLLPAVSMERVWQEFCKMSSSPYFDKAILLLHQYGLLQTIFPSLKEISSEKIQTQIAAFPYFPLHTPPIAYLLELFPFFSLEEGIGLCSYLKTSKKERHLVEFFYASRQLLHQANPELWQWAHFYAHPHAELFLQIEAAKKMPPSRSEFLEIHEKRIHQLEKHITRIRKRKPLVTSKHLKEAGIQPGQEMGRLLKEAERISINHDLSDPKAVIRIALQQGPQ